MRIEIVSRLEMRGEEEDKTRVGMIGRWAIRMMPEQITEPRR